MAARRRPSADELLAHEGFIRGMVGNLLPDESSLDDVLQETWLAALQKPPERTAALRSWLAVVAGNIARKSKRGEGRRTRREQAVARAEYVPPTDEVAARDAVDREVVGAIVTLREPLRTTVLLRFYKGMTIAEVARHLRVSKSTVRKRLGRAFHVLRVRLGRWASNGRDAPPTGAGRGAKT